MRASHCEQLRAAPGPKLRFLAEVVLAEAAHLHITDARLFAEPMTAEPAAALSLAHSTTAVLDGATAAMTACILVTRPVG